MSSTLNYRKYVTTSLSTYPRFYNYNTTHIIKGIWVPLPPRTLAMLRRRSCHCGHRTVAAGVDEAIPDLAPAMVRIRLVVAGAEVGDPDPAYIVVDK
jgi:hypothetical protein